MWPPMGGDMLPPLFTHTISEPHILPIAYTISNLHRCHVNGLLLFNFKLKLPRELFSQASSHGEAGNSLLWRTQVWLETMRACC